MHAELMLLYLLYLWIMIPKMKKELGKIEKVRSFSQIFAGGMLPDPLTLACCV